MTTTFSNQRRSLLSSQARIQSPFIKVTIGDYTFGVYNRSDAKATNTKFYQSYNVQYPNYINSLSITKLNGQVNTYTLSLIYPVTQEDDVNFFEKVISSAGKTRKIIFTYGDSSQPSFVYKNEEALITQVNSNFSLRGGTIIQYTITAISNSALSKSGSYNFINSGKKKPSDEIKNIFKNRSYGLQDLFTGMKIKDLDKFIAGDDQYVTLESKLHISVLDYITYLTSCMIPQGQSTNNISTDIYILTIHDNSTYDQLYNNYEVSTGPYFKITRTSYLSEQNDAYEIDIGFNTNDIVLSFEIKDSQNYSLYYDYQENLNPESYKRVIDKNGEWGDVYVPNITSGNDTYMTRPNDISWWTKITKYPINATITIQGLLRPATLMTYVRLNVIFYGRKHISSGLYIVTNQQDTIDSSGYRTTLSLTRISGDNNIEQS